MAKNRELAIVIKVFKYILIGLITLVIVVNATVYVALSIPSVQQKITFFATKELQTLLKTEVKIKEIDFEFFNKVIIKDIYIADREGQPMLKAKRLAVSLNITELLNNRLEINTVQLYSFDVKLNKKTPKSKPNYQFILDAFKSDPNSKSKPLTEIQVHSVVIRRGNINYDVFSEPYQFGKFNANHIRVKNLLATMAIYTINKDSANVQIKRLSFEENSGFAVKKLALQLCASKKKLELKSFNLQLPNSELELAQVSLDVSKVDSLHPFNDFGRFKIEIPNSKICLHDISAFVPAFRYYNDNLRLEAYLTGTVNSIRLDNLKINSQQNIRLKAQVNLEGISDPKNAYIFGKISEITINPQGANELLDNFMISDPKLRGIIHRAGLFQFNGEISGYLSDVVAFGSLRTDLGKVRTDIMISQDTLRHRTNFTGKVKTEEFKLGQLLDNSDFGILSMNVNLNTYQRPKSLPQGKLKGVISQFDFKKYAYKNIDIDGLFEGKRYEGSLVMNDPNGFVSIKGKVNMDSKNAVYNVNGKVKHLDLNALHLSSKYPNSLISFSIKTDLKGRLPDNVEGEARIDSLLFLKNGDAIFYDNIRLISSINEVNKRSLELKSPIINGEVKGQFTFASLTTNMMYVLGKYMPVFSDVSKPTNQKNDVEFNFRFENTERESAMLELPFTIKEQSTFKGAYSDFTQRFFIESNIPSLKIKKSTYEGISIIANNDNRTINLSTNFRTASGKKDFVNYGISLEAQNDQADCHLTWSNSSLKTYSGDLTLNALLFKHPKETALGVDVHFKPSTMIMNDTLWNIAPANIVVDRGRISVHDFMVSKKDQFVKIDGNVSKSLGDTLNLSLKDVNLDYIFNTLNIANVKFSGIANGDFVLNNLMREPVLLTDNLHIKDFGYNGTRFGELRLHSQWDADKLGILMKGSIVGYLGNTSAVNGYIFPTKDSISMNFDAQKLNVEFLKPFLGGILKDMSGYASGRAQLFGNFSRLNVAGDVKMQDFRFGIDYLNTYYTINDSLHLRANSIYFNNILILDKDKNSAIATGRITHNHLSNWKYNIQIATNNLLSFNGSPKNNAVYYGPVYASGKVSIVGDEARTNIDVNMKTGEGTKFVLSLNDQQNASEYNFITFRDRRQEMIYLQREEDDELKRKMPELFSKPNTNSSNELNLNLLIDIAPVSNLVLVMDPVSRDEIQTYGSGNMRLNYNSKKDMQLFGTYTIDRGTYSFSLQDIIQKRFSIKDGSTVTFRGNPYSADLGIRALYTTTADLNDLDESFSLDKDVSRTRTQVQCIIDLTGDMYQPDIKFDLNLPNNTEEVNRRMKSLVNTDDMMARQIIYLLTLSRFYTPDYLNTGRNQGGGELSSLASATLSSQLNNVFAQMTDKVQIGTNIKLQDANSNTNTEVEVALSSQLLNNRLLVNGNLGYRDNTANKTTFIGDFDAEYKLTKSGEWRLKGYNRSNDRSYYIKSSLTTQGLGIVYKKDFDNLMDIFRKKLKSTPVDIKATPATVK